MKTVSRWLFPGLIILVLSPGDSRIGLALHGQDQGRLRSTETQRTLVNQYCAGCHNDTVRAGGFSWTEVDLAHPEQKAELAEKVIRKVRSGMMPPAGARRPETAVMNAFAAALETRIDEAAAANPYVDSPELHRVNRTEYRNSVRDLLGIDVDVSALLPPDARTSGFDNLADALTITPALMQGYMKAADKISREAIGDPTAPAAMVSYRIPKVVNQMRHIEGTPFGTRGGISVNHTFPSDGQYTFQAELHYSYTGGSAVGASLPEALQGQQLDISVDRERVALITIDPGLTETEGILVTAAITVKAGQRRLSASFISRFDGPVQDQYRLVENTLVDVGIAGQTEQTGLPHLQTLSVTGPFSPTGVSETRSRQKIFTCRPSHTSEEDGCATQIVSQLASQAFRRPARAEDLESLMDLYRAGKAKGGFEIGIRTALQTILAKPEFVFRFERVPVNAKPGETFSISDIELASRLSYFLWSSLPDEQLVALASQGRLKDTQVLEQQVKRMLADPRSEALSSNFAGQWLRLQDIRGVAPEPTYFPDFTRNLGLSMRREVELLFDNIVREDSNIIDLLTADYTYMDETLARHYGFGNVLGTRFKRVPVTDPNRIGLLGKSGVLTMTSLANRTSPVARGKYVLEVLIGSPPPPPPPAVPPLKENVDNEKTLTVRGRMEQHRQNPACSACHKIMDPIGMALENFDAVGSWRTNDGGFEIDPSGEMYDGTPLDGPISVREAVLNRSDTFILSFTRNLMTYGVGRVLDYRDMPTVRAIAREASRDNNRFSLFVMGIVRSPQFRMRTLSSPTAAEAGNR